MTYQGYKLFHQVLYKALYFGRAERLIAEIEAAILKVATEKWGAKAEGIIKDIRGNNMRFNFRDGDSKSDYDGYAGNMFISASNKASPLVVDRNRSPLTAHDGKPYSCCYINATIGLYGYDNKGKGISASLSGGQFFRDGDAFAGGGVASVNDFDDLSEVQMLTPIQKN
ncbi:ssDNA-binding protein [Xenorhabdus mauleonii]